MLVVVFFYHSITHSLSLFLSLSPVLSCSPFTYPHARTLDRFLAFPFRSHRVYISHQQNAFRFRILRNGINIFIYFGISSGSLTNFYFEDGSKWMRVSRERSVSMWICAPSVHPSVCLSISFRWANYTSKWMITVRSNWQRVLFALNIGRSFWVCHWHKRTYTHTRSPFPG